MKRILCIALTCLLLLFAMAGCAEPTRYDYDLSEYIELGQVQPISAYFEDPEVCTEEEVDQALFQVMLSYAEFTVKEGGVAEQYNKLEMVYDLYHEDKPLEDYHEDSYEIIIESDDFGDLDYLLGQAFLGACVGDTKSIEYTFPEDDMTIGFWAGMTIEAEGTLTAIYQHHVPECTDEFVSALEGYSFETVADFREQLALDLKETKREKKAEAVYDAFMDGVKVKKYPEKELEEYIEAYQSDSIALAEQLEMSYEDYVKEYLFTDLATFQASAKKESEKQVKTDMACIQLSRLFKTTLTQEEYEEGRQLLYENAGGVDSGFATVEEFEKDMTTNEIRQRLLWKKSFDSLVENAVRLDVNNGSVQ